MRIAGKSAAEIFESIRALTQSGQFLAGQNLPTVRELAQQLNVNRNTVSAAYQRLVNAGIAVTRGRHGTFIREVQQAGEQEGSPWGSPLIDIASGNPDPARLPNPLQYLTVKHYSTRLYGEAVINPELEDYIRSWFSRDCRRPFEVNLTHGAVDAMERLLMTHLVTGDKVAIEDPCFLGSINTLRIQGFQTLPVAVDAKGMQPEALERALADGARAVICTPRAHNPTGCSLDARRASALKKILAHYPHAMIIEDDHFALLAEEDYRSVIAPGSQHWAVVRSVSKCYGPDLRIAFVASDVDTSRQLRLRLASGTTWVSHILQNIVCNMLTDKKVVTHIEKAKKVYAKKRTALIEALESAAIPVQKNCDGLNVWIPLTVPARDVTEKMAHRGWLTRSGEAFYVGDIQQALRVTISAMSTQEIEKFVQDLKISLASL